MFILADLFFAIAVQVTRLRVGLVFGLGMVFVVTIVLAATGKDLETFERFRLGDPKLHSRMKATYKINGPVVVLLSVVSMIGSAFAILVGEIDLATAATSISVAAVLLWLSVRWTGWGYR